jgi:circadian clock protein KaiC
MDTSRESTERISTGIEGLDELLTGGLIRGANIMIEGLPGTGKSTIAMQFILAGIDRGEPGIYISLEESPVRLYRDAASFGWDFRKLESENKLRVIATSSRSLIEQMHKGGPLIEAIHEIGARRGVIDTVSMLQSASNTPEDFRETLRSLIVGLEREGLTLLLTRDEEPEAAGISSAFWSSYTVDALVHLRTEILHERLARRVMEIFKTRGQEHIRGRHAYETGRGGVRVFARVLQPTDREFPLEQTRVSSGITGLDDMLSGGFFSEQIALVSGPTGSGKTTLTLHFLAESAREGHPVLLVSTEESAEQIIVHAASSGLDIRRFVEQGLLDIEHMIETEIEPDELLFRLRKRLAEKPYRRVGIDSINAIERMSPTPAFATDALIYLMHVLENRHVAAIMSFETPMLTGILEVTRIGISALASTVVLLRLVEIEGDVKKALFVLKHRGSPHATDVRQLMIDGDGIRVLSGFEGYQGVLTGIPVILKGAAGGAGLGPQ